MTWSLASLCRCVAALGLPLWVCLAAQAADLGAAFDQANRLYEQGKFAEAAAAYETLARAGQVSPALCFNLGNAWFKAGRLGRAILNYRRAEELAPRDPDIQANLRFARNTVPGATSSTLPPLRRWAIRLTVNEWTTLTAIGIWAWFTLLALREAHPPLRVYVGRFVLAAALWVLASGLGLWLAWQERIQKVAAVVVERDVIMRHGPLEESPSLQTLQDGQELVVLDQKDNWLQVKGASRGIGWLKRDQVSLLGW